MTKTSRLSWTRERKHERCRDTWRDTRERQIDEDEMKSEAERWCLIKVPLIVYSIVEPMLSIMAHLSWSLGPRCLQPPLTPGPPRGPAWSSWPASTVWSWISCCFGFQLWRTTWASSCQQVPELSWPLTALLPPRLSPHRQNFEAAPLPGGSPGSAALAPSGRLQEDPEGCTACPGSSQPPSRCSSSPSFSSLLSRWRSDLPRCRLAAWISARFLVPLGGSCFPASSFPCKSLSWVAASCGFCSSGWTKRSGLPPGSGTRPPAQSCWAAALAVGRSWDWKQTRSS